MSGMSLGSPNTGDLVLAEPEEVKSPASSSSEEAEQPIKPFDVVNNSFVIDANAFTTSLDGKIILDLDSDKVGLLIDQLAKVLVAKDFDPLSKQRRREKVTLHEVENYDESQDALQGTLSSRLMEGIMKSHSKNQRILLYDGESDRKEQRQFELLEKKKFACLNQLWKLSDPDAQNVNQMHRTQELVNKGVKGPLLDVLCEDGLLSSRNSIRNVVYTASIEDMFMPEIYELYPDPYGFFTPLLCVDNLQWQAGDGKWAHSITGKIHYLMREAIEKVYDEALRREQMLQEETGILTFINYSMLTIAIFFLFSSLITLPHRTSSTSHRIWSFQACKSQS